MNSRVDRSRSPRSLWIAGAIVLLLVSFFMFQLGLADRNRKRFDAELAALGVPDWRALVPRMPPAEENFFTAPIVQRWLPMKGTTKPVPQFTADDEDVSEGPPVLPGWLLGEKPEIAELANLPVRGTELSLEALGLWLDKWDSAAAEFRAAGQRPYAQLPGDYSSPELVPVLNFVRARSLVRVLATRARVHLLQHRDDLALLDLDMIEVLMRALESRPATLVAAMIRVAVAGLYVEVVKDGFTMDLWKTENLEPLRVRLERIQLVPTVLSSLREGEMAAACYLLDQMADGKLAHRRRILGMLGSNTEWRDKALAFLPSSSVRRNQLLVAQLMKTWLDVFERDGSRYYPKRGKAGNIRVNEAFGKWRLGNALAGSFVPNVSRACEVCARTQTRFQQAVIVCELERYRRRQGSYPETLAELQGTNSKEMPTDLVTGLPYLYRRAATDKFILYSVGEDEVDDGGGVKDWEW